MEGACTIPPAAPAHADKGLGGFSWPRITHRFSLVPTPKELPLPGLRTRAITRGLHPPAVGRGALAATQASCGVGVSPLPAAARALASPPRDVTMKITRVEAIHLRLPDVNERCDGSQETLVVKVHTDAGIVGVGEVDSSSLVAKAIIEAPLSHKICRGLAECVLGQDPFEIDRLIHRMYEGSIFFGRQGAVIQAMSGIEIALWDIVGKATGRPVYQLLGGGFRKKFRAYASILFGDTPAETRAHRRASCVEQGYRAVKFGWGPMGQSEASDIAHVRAAREGPRAGRRADGRCRPVLGHGHRHPPGAAVRAVQPDLAGGAAAPRQPAGLRPA